MGTVKGKFVIINSELIGHDSILQTVEGFHGEISKSASTEELQEIKNVFHTMDVSIQATTKWFYLYTRKQKFKRLFKFALREYDSLLKKPKRHHQNHYLKNHCFAVINCYKSLIESIVNLQELDEELIKIGRSHSFISNIRCSLMLHTDLFYKFITNEYSRCINVDIQNVMKTVLKLIGARLIILIDQFNAENKIENAISTMEMEKINVQGKMEEVANLNDVYVNPTIRQESAQFSLVPFGSSNFLTSNSDNEYHSIKSLNV